VAALRNAPIGALRAADVHMPARMGLEPGLGFLRRPSREAEPTLTCS
jgi:hypothetical protein